MPYHKLHPGTKIFGRHTCYILSDIIGHEDDGLIYLAEGKAKCIQKIVWIKVFCPQTSNLKFLDGNSEITDTDEEVIIENQKRRFLEESLMLEQCKHPGIIKVCETIEESDYCFSVREYIEGKTLKRIIEEYACSARNVIPEYAAEHLIRKIGSAISYLHENGIVHRAVNPENIIVTSDFDIILVNFTRSLFLRRNKTVSSPLLPNTQSGYDAPEMSTDTPVFSTQVDLYSFGVVFRSLLTGIIPANQFDVKGMEVEYEKVDRIPEDYVIAIKLATYPFPTSRLRNISAFFSILDYGYDALTPGQRKIVDESHTGNAEYISFDQLPDENFETKEGRGKNRKRNKGSVKRFLFNVLLIAEFIFCIYWMFRIHNTRPAPFRFIFDFDLLKTTILFGIMALTACGGVFVKQIVLKKYTLIISLILTMIFALNTI